MIRDILRISDTLYAEAQSKKENDEQRLRNERDEARSAKVK